MAAAAAYWQDRVRNRTILVVEDEVLIRMDIADELRRRGFVVLEAANADEALTVVETGAPVDLVFSDIRMPGSLDGVALTDRLRKTHPHLKLTLASAVAPPWPTSAMIDAFFGKPYDVARVAQHLEDIILREQS